MRRIKLYILLFIIFLINITVVKADCDAPIVSAGELSSTTNFHERFNGDTNAGWVHNYYLKYEFHDQYNISNSLYGICMQPQVSYSDKTSNKYCRTSVLKDKTTAREQKIDYGALWIAKKLADDSDFYSLYGGYCNRLTGNNKEDCKYTTVSIALRVYSVLFDSMNKMNPNLDKAKTYYAFVNEIIDSNDPVSKEIGVGYQRLTGEFLRKNNIVIDVPVAFSYDTKAKSYAKESILKDEVKSLISDAIKEAINYKTTNGKTEIENYYVDEREEEITTGYSIPRTFLNSVINGLISLDDIDNYSWLNQFKKPIKKKVKVVEYTFEAKNFDNKTLTLSYECEKCKKNSKINNNVYVKNTNGEYILISDSNTTPENLTKHIKDDKLVIKLVFYSDDSKFCENIDYKLQFSYYDEEGEAYIYYNESYEKNYNKQLQEFIVFVDKETIATSKTEFKRKSPQITNTINLCASCDSLKKECEDGNNDESCKNALELECYKNCTDLKMLCDRNIGDSCSRYKQKCEKEPCNTHIDNITCANNTTLTAADGYSYNSSKCSNETLDVLNCIIDNKDIAGNNYKATNIENEYNYIKNNKYCTISCREEYQLSMPGDKNVQSGRYFTLQVNNRGLKACYTSKIDPDNEFNNDLEKARKNIVSSWNNWSKWYNGYMSEDWVQYTSPAAQFELCDKEVTIENDNGSSQTVCAHYACSVSDYYTGWKKVWEYGTYEPDGTFAGYDDNDGGSVACGYCGCSHVDGTKDKVEADIASNLQGAIASLNASIKAYINLVNMYNACSGINTIKYNDDYSYTTTTTWKMDYTYNPDITFDYQEVYMKIAKQNKLDTKVTSSVSSPTQTSCSSNVDKSYECKSEFASGGPIFDERKPFICYYAGSGVYKCDNIAKTIKISKSKYVKQEMKVEASYITPTQFVQVYPQGDIVTLNDSELFSNAEYLENKLPVSLSTTRGTYNYILKINNLGEYYDSNKLGRLIGEEKSVLVSSLNDTVCKSEGALTLKQKIERSSQSATYENGVYVCHYYVDYYTSPRTYSCEYNNGNYYNRNGVAVTEAEARENCCYYDGTFYYEFGPIMVNREKYIQDCGGTPTNYVCKKVGENYYDKDGKVVSLPEAKNSCCYYDGTKYYEYSDNGPKEVTKAQFDVDCNNNNNNYRCEYANGNYYDKDGKVVSLPEAKSSCCYYDGTNYYEYSDNGPKKVTKTQFDTDCNNNYRCEYHNGSYYDKEGNAVKLTEAKKSCCYYDGTNYYEYSDNGPIMVNREKYIQDCGDIPTNYVCKRVNGRYYDKDGKAVTLAEAKESCCYYDGTNYYVYSNYGPKKVTKTQFDVDCNNNNNNYRCEYANGNYYDKDGKVVTITEAKNSCCYYDGTKYYEYSNNGPKEVTKAQFDVDCNNNNNNYRCQYANGNYYDKDGKVVTITKAKKSCCYYDGTNYYEYSDNGPITVDEKTYIKDCLNEDIPTSDECYKDDLNDIYYDNNGILITEDNKSPYLTKKAKYMAVCCPNGNCPVVVNYKCIIANGSYYGPNGEVLSNQKDYIEKCFTCPTCPTVCEVCIRNNIVYRSVTPADMNPNDRKLGKNWRFDENNITTGMELKAFITTNEIIEDGESVYDVSANGYDDFAFEIKMNASMINYIKTHNANTKDGFSNNSLTCYDYTNPYDEKVYKNIFCYSNFIDDLLNKYSSQIKITGNRPTVENRKNYKPNGVAYWTTWSDAKIKLSTTYELSYFIDYGTNNNIGPSWK